MKKKLFVLLSIASILFAPVANAMDNKAIQAEINSITQEILHLQAQLPSPKLGNSYPGNLNPATGTILTLGSPLTLSGVATTTITGDGTNSFIANFNTILNVPTNFATAGCAGNIANTDFGACINALYNSVSSTASSVLIMIPAITVPSSSWKTSIVFGNNGERASLQCVPGGGTQLNWNQTTTIAITENTGAGTGSAGHVFGSRIDGCLLVGPQTLGTNGSSTAIFIGGTNGAEGFVLSNNTIRKFAVGVEYGANEWQVKTLFNAITQNAINVQTDLASNSLETMVYFGNDFFDPLGTSTAAQGCINLIGNGASIFFDSNSFDDCGVQVGAGALNIAFTNNHLENPAANTTYGNYYYLNVATSTFTTLSMSFDTFMNDATSSGQSPGAGVAFVNCGGFCNAQNVTADQNGAAATITSFMTNANAPSTAVETVCNSTNVNGTSITNWINGVNSVPYQTSGCLSSSLGGWPIGTTVDSANVMKFYDGGGAIGSFNASGNWNFGSGNQATTTVQISGSLGGKINTSGTSSTLSAASSLTQVFTGASASTDTLPTIVSSQGQILIFKNRGTAALSIAASTTAPDFIWQSAVNASATVYSLIAGSSTAFQNDGTYWSQLWR